MTATAYTRGYEIFFDEKDNMWKYCDSHDSSKHKRACKRCGRIPLKGGYDACLGKIEGVKHACCGHGIESQKYMIYKNKKSIKRKKNGN